MTQQAEFYIIIGDHGPHGMGARNPCYNLEDAADALGEVERLTGRDARAIYVDLFAETVRNVTKECLDVIAARRKAAQ